MLGYQAIDRRPTRPFVVRNGHRAAAAAQVRLGRIMEQCVNSSEVKPGDQMYLYDSPQHSPPHQVPYKLASRWMGAEGCPQGPPR